MNIDISTFQPAFGRKGIEKKYTRELGRIKRSSKQINNGSPTLIGEFGIPFDLDEGAAYKAYARGDDSSKPWKHHIMALDLMYNALDRLLISSTQWNYTASNLNEARSGDGFNQEDLSIFSVDQRHTPEDILSGGRAMEGWVRPFVHYVQGVLLKMRFSRKKGLFHLHYRANPAIPRATEVFVPKFQYPHGYDLKIEGAGMDVVRDDRRSLLLLTANADQEILLTLTKRSDSQQA